MGTIDSLPLDLQVEDLQVEGLQCESNGCSELRGDGAKGQGHRAAKKVGAGDKIELGVPRVRVFSDSDGRRTAAQQSPIGQRHEQDLDTPSNQAELLRQHGRRVDLVRCIWRAPLCLQWPHKADKPGGRVNECYYYRKITPLQN